jgi:hypothetical protein
MKYYCGEPFCRELGAERSDPGIPAFGPAWSTAKLEIGPAILRIAVHER